MGLVVSVRGIAFGAALLFGIYNGHGLVRTAAPGAAQPAAATAPPSEAASGAIALHADRRGHFVTSAVVNGRVVSMLVDTGATLCSFSEEEAENLGLHVSPRDFTQVVSTANGLVHVAPVRLRLVQIGPVALRDVQAVIVPRGRLGGNLLGMSFLSRLREFNVAGTRMTLKG